MRSRPCLHGHDRASEDIEGRSPSTDQEGRGSVRGEFYCLFPNRFDFANKFLQNSLIQSISKKIRKNEDPSPAPITL